MRGAACTMKSTPSAPGKGMRPYLSIAGTARIVEGGAPELLNWVNVFVFQRKLNGDLDRLSRQWFGEPLPELPIL